MNRSILKKLPAVLVMAITLTLIGSHHSYAQTDISGTVVDAENGSPLGGVNISVKVK